MKFLNSDSSNFFDPALGGDPAWYQHLIWLLGHTESWLFIAKIILFLTGITLITRYLSRTDRKLWAWFVAIGFAVLISFTFYLFKDIQQFFMQGFIPEDERYKVTIYRLVGHTFNIGAGAVLIWLVYKLLRRASLDTDS